MQPDVAHGDRLAAAALRLELGQPYIASALWAVNRIPAPGLGTFGVDIDWNVYYDPAVVLDWTLDEIATALYHEVLHLLRDHAHRCLAGFDPGLWNIAADAEINDDLQAERLPLRRGAVVPRTFGAKPGRLAEEYYRRLLKSGRPATAAGEEGSGVTGVRAGWETGRRQGDHITGQGRARRMTVFEAEIIRDDVAKAVLQRARGAGSTPGHWSRWANDRLEPRVDWRRQLAVAVRSGVRLVAGMQDYTYSRPSRRQAAGARVVLPAMVSPDPQVAVVIDTSGSMDAEYLGCALSELRGILARAGCTRGTRVLSVDSHVHACRTAFRVRDVELIGGGGTDMARGISAALALRPRPEVVVVLTDGRTPWPEARPARAHVIAGLIGEGAPRPPAWIRSISIPKGEAEPEEGRDA